MNTPPQHISATALCSLEDMHFVDGQEAEETMISVFATKDNCVQYMNENWSCKDCEDVLEAVEDCQGGLQLPSYCCLLLLLLLLSN